jgi:hypothetical protein
MPSSAPAAAVVRSGIATAASRKGVSSALCALRTHSASARGEKCFIGAKLSHRYARNFSHSGFRTAHALAHRYHR